MEVFYTSLNAKELFSIPSTIRMTIHKCFNQEIQFYNWVYIYIFYIYLSIIFFFFFFFGVHGTSFIDLEEKETRTRFL